MMLVCAELKESSATSLLLSTIVTMADRNAMHAITIRDSASSPVRERPSDILEDVEALSKRSNQPWPHWLKGDSLKNSLRLLENLTGSTPKKVIPTNGI